MMAKIFNQALFLSLMGVLVSWATAATAQSTRLPDLVVESLVLDPAEPEPQVAVELKATISNRGQERVTTHFSVFFEVNDSFLALRQLSMPLDPGQQAEARTLWTPSQGEHRLRVHVDAFDEILESNERNNSLELRIEVRRPEGVRPITPELFKSIGEGLQKAGQAIQVPPNNDLTQLINAFQLALGIARQELFTSAERLAGLKRSLPKNLMQEAQIQAADQATALYRSLVSALDKAIEGIQRLNSQLLLNAFQQVRVTLVELSALSIEGMSLSELSQTVALMDQGLEKAQQLQAALGGSSNGVDVNAAVQDLLAIIAQVGQLWVRVGENVIQTGQEKAARFTDSQGRPIVKYQPAQELRISVAKAHLLKFEVFTAEGQVVFISLVQGEQLTWRGTNAEGKPLSPGRYFYRLTTIADDSPGPPRVELGQIIVSEGS